MGRRFQWPGVARLVCAARWVFPVFIRAHWRVMICAAAPATLRIARLAEADSQVRRPALRIVLPGCSIRDQGRWVCAFRRDGSPAALADAGGSAPVVGGPVARRTSWISPVHRSEVHLEMKEDRTVARDADVRGQRELAASSSRPSPDGGDRDSRHLAEPDQIIQIPVLRGRTRCYCRHSRPVGPSGPSAP